MDLLTVCSELVGCRGNAFSSWVVTVIWVIPVGGVKWRRFGGRVNYVVVVGLCTAKPTAPIILMVGDPNSKVSFQLLVVALGLPIRNRVIGGRGISLDTLAVEPGFREVGNEDRTAI